MDVPDGNILEVFELSFGDAIIVTFPYTTADHAWNVVSSCLIIHVLVIVLIVLTHIDTCLIRLGSLVTVHIVLKHQHLQCMILADNTETLVGNCS